MPTEPAWRFVSSPTRRVLHYHVAASLGIVLAILALSAVLASQMAQQEATRNAREVGRGLATGLIAPMVTPGLRRGDPLEIGRLDAVIRSRLRASSIARVKVWSTDGTVLYSDAEQLVGQRFQLQPEDRLLEAGSVDSEISDLSRPENAYERELKSLLEVYTSVNDPSGQPLLVEVYFSELSLDRRARELRSRILLVVLVALVLFECFLIPLSVWLARRTEHAEHDRLEAEHRAQESRLAERRRLAGELHDGVIQDLSAIGYALHAVTAGLRTRPAAELESMIVRTTDILRSDIATLRGMTSSLYTTTEKSIDLAAAVRELVDELAVHGVTAEVSDLPELPVEVVWAVFQVARETLRNSIRHSGSAAHLTLGMTAAGLVLRVADDGQGYDPSLVGGPVEGHLGLSLLRDATARANGELEVRTAPGAGTVVLLTIPVGHSPHRT